VRTWGSRDSSPRGAVHTCNNVGEGVGRLMVNQTSGNAGCYVFGTVLAGGEPPRQRLLNLYKRRVVHQPVHQPAMHSGEQAETYFRGNTPICRYLLNNQGQK
jgi:hypothetical protein